MTYNELYQQGKRELRKAGVDTPAFDAVCLFSHCCGLDRAGLLMRGGEEASKEQASAFLRCVKERASRRPLQYILGEWEFMGLPFFMGEGVLVPREDTEALVRCAAQNLLHLETPAVLDLCAGSGAVSIGLCSLLPGARVTAAELSDRAFFYLEKNVERHRMDVTPVKLDVLHEELPGKSRFFDAIVSNPPYIPRGDLTALQPEVQHEPALALDGGEDGMLFYRAICERFLPLLKPGGFIAVEIGAGQALNVQNLFSAHGLQKIEIRRDLGKIERVVIGWRTS